MIIEFDINGARVIVTGDNLTVSISEDVKHAVKTSGASPSTVKRRTIEQIIKAAGGASLVSRASGPSLTYDAVYKWSKNGIPDRHWPLLISLADASAEELFHANISARETAA
jgi:hypothetical protein